MHAVGHNKIFPTIKEENACFPLRLHSIEQEKRKYKYPDVQVLVLLSLPPVYTQLCICDCSVVAQHCKQFRQIRNSELLSANKCIYLVEFVS